MKSLLGGLLLSAALAGSAAAQAPAAPAPNQPPDVTQVARWKVFYLDSRLGVVLGDAAVDWQEQRAVVSFSFEGKDYRLDSELMQGPGKDDPHAHFRFRGASPDGTTTARPDTSGATPLAGNGEAVVKAGREEDHFVFGVPNAPEQDTVTVELAVDGEGDLQGRWSYDADPITLGDAKRGGRRGRFTMASDGSFGGQQSGSELWIAARPEIEAAIVLENQLEIPHFLSGVYDPTGTADRRTLFIVGHNLPFAKRGSYSDNIGKFESATPGVKYTYHGQSGDQMPDSDKVKIRHGWIAAYRLLKDFYTRAEIDAMEGALVEVTLPRDYVPDVLEFTWAGAKVPWRVLSGDALAEVSFVRQIGDAPPRYETMTEAYLPEDVAVEIRLRTPIPYDAFEVKVQPFTGPPGGTATATASEHTFVANKIAPQLYRTGPISLTRGAGGVAMAPGQVLIAHARPKTGLLSGPASAQLPTVLSPQVKAPAPGASPAQPPELRPAWIEYLQRAAKTQGIAPDDPRVSPDLAFQKETTISRAIFYLQDNLNTDIYFGDHAAMLLLRDTFCDMMQDSKRFLAKSAETDESALGFATLAREMLRADPQAPLGRLDAGDLGGQHVTLAQALDPVAQRKVFGDDDEARDKWLVGAARAAIAAYGPKLQAAYDTAHKIPDGDIEELLKLTGNGFDNVVATATPRLMRIENRVQRWVPDSAARGYVGGLKNRFEQYRIIQSASDDDTKAYIATIAALTRLPIAYEASAYAYTVAAAGQGLFLLYSTTTSVYEEIKRKQELKFAFGASPILGSARFEEAELEDPGWGKTLAFIGLDVVLTTQAIFADIHQAQVALQVARGARMVEESTLPIFQMAKLTEGERRNLLAFILDARALRTQGKTLTRVQTAALAAFDRLGEIGAKDPEGLAKGLAAVGKLREAEKAVAERLEQAVAAGGKKELKATLELRRDSIVEIWRAAAEDPRVLAKLTEFDLNWLSGAIVEADESRAIGLVAGHNLDWHELKSSFQAGWVSAAEMHNFVTWRETFVKKLLKESIDEVAAAVEKETGTKPELVSKALGSTNLTSDLDFSVYGLGAERVVKVFNDKFRALAQFRGLESGHVFDTNVYTQAVYELFGRKELVGQTLGVANADLDALQQLMYEQMATRKYIGSLAAWEQHKSAILGAADEATGKMYSSAFEEVEHAYEAAQMKIAGRLGVSGEEALHAAEGTNGLLKATNNAYEELLADIGQWRNERLRLEQLMTRQPVRVPDPPPEFLARYPGWQVDLENLKTLAAAGKFEEFDTLAKKWVDRLNFQLRKKQGEALFYASEAYQDDYTIMHVVRDLQEAKRGKLITLAKLQGGKMSTVLDKMDGRGALNSMMENLANLRKELGHADDATKAAAKGGKYFIRVLDAGHEAGIDVVKILGEDLVKVTLGVDARRASIDQVEAFLKASGTTDEAYVKAIEKAHETLAIEAVKHKDVTALAARLRSIFDEIPGVKEAVEKTAAIGEQAH